MKTVVPAQYCFHSRAQKEGCYLLAVRIRINLAQHTKGKSLWQEVEKFMEAHTMMATRQVSLCETSFTATTITWSHQTALIITFFKACKWQRPTSVWRWQNDTGRCGNTCIFNVATGQNRQCKKKAWWWVCAKVIEGLASLQHLSNTLKQKKKKTTWKVKCSFFGLSSSLFNVLLQGPCPQKPHHGTNAE